MKKILYIFLLLLFLLRLNSVVWAYGYTYFINNTTVQTIYRAPVRNLSVANITTGSFIYASILDDFGYDYTFDNVHINNNSVTGLYLSSGGAKIYNSSFSHNAQSAIYSYTANLLKHLENVTFSYNNISGSGAAISATSYNPITVSNVTFNNNTANSNGGAISSSSLHIKGKNIYFNNNSANNGGAIYTSGNLILETNGGDIVFNNNTASNNGAAIYSGGDTTLIAENGNISFNNNGPLYIAGNLYLKPNTNGNIIFNDKININSGNIFIEGADTGLVAFNKTLENKTIYAQAGNIYFNPSQNWTQTSLIVNGNINLNLHSTTIYNLQLNNITLNAPLKVIPKIDMLTGNIDTITANASGSEKLYVPDFKILSSNINTPTTVNFASGAIRYNIAMTDITYDDIYAYGVSYSPYSGKITFTPKHLEESRGFGSVRSFNPQVYLQPQSAYSIADSTLRSLQSRIDIKKHIDDYYSESNRFYIQPFYQNYELKFNNDAESEQSNKGIKLGYISQDLEWFNNFIATSGIYANLQYSDLKQEKVNISSTDYQVGTDLYINSTNFFSGLIAQIGISNRKDIFNDNIFNWGVEAEAGLHFNINQSLSWEPFVAYSLVHVGKGKDIFIQSAHLSSNATDINQLKGGINLIKAYKDFSTHFDIAYLMQKSSNNIYMVNNQVLPNFELDPFVQFGTGIKYSNNSYGILFDLNADIGSITGLEAHITLEF